MPIYPASRPEKALEHTHRPEGRNTIVTVYIAGAGGGPQIEWGPDYAATAAHHSIEQALDLTVDMGRVPLLWTYAKPDANYTELKLGFDEKLGNTDKIGHMALVANATISGEIARNGAAWSIDNESGAWGNMGGAQGKSNMMREVALFITTHCGMQVSAKRAYSSNLFKRKIQQIFR